MTRPKPPKLRLVVAAAGALAFILQGYDQALMNGILTLDSFVRQFPQLDTAGQSSTSSTTTLQGTVVALYEVGSAIGSIACFFIGDWLGRRKTIMLASCIVIIGVTLQASPFELAQLIVARVITGIGVGIFTSTIPVWVSECSRADNRGKMVMLEGMFGIGGVFLVTWMELGFFFVKNNTAGWRFPIAFQALFALGVLGFVALLPESPRWLVASGKPQAALEVLGKLSDTAPETDSNLHDLQEIQTSIDSEHGGDTANLFALTEDRQFHRTVLAVILNILAQMCGVNLIAFYSNIIFSDTLHFSPLLSRIITGCLQTWQFVFASIGVFLVDRFGRRPLLIISFAALATAHAGLAALTKFQANHAAAGASLLFDFIALSAFPVGLFLIPFLYSAEISTLRTRARVTALASSANWLFNFLIAEITPFAFATIDWKYYFVYMCTSILGAVVVFFFAPETRGRSLEEIDQIFICSKSIFDPVRVAGKMLPVRYQHQNSASPSDK